jgi:hypothetical protein
VFGQRRAIALKVFAFRELSWHDAGGVSLKDAVRPAPHPDRAGILAYLRSGRWFAVRPLVVPDYFRPERGWVSNSHWYTDGEWIWPTDLIYYVAEYHVELPPERVDRMASLGWACPPLSGEQVRRVGEWWHRWQEGE